MYRARDSRECSQISNDGAMRNCSAGTNLQTRPRCTLFAPTQGLHFQALHPLSFFFICTLHWYKYCTVLVVTTNVRKFPMTTLCGIAAHGHISRPSLSVRFWHRRKGLHFQALHHLSFLLICTLHWCKQCTVLEIAANVRKSPMKALCVIAAQILICRSVLAVRFLQRPMVYIFRLSIPLALFSYAPFIGASIVP